MTDRTVDAVVIGSGPGGYVAGIRLGQLGLEAVVVEREEVGGVCLNWGCIPSKALIVAASFVDRCRRASTMGVTVSGVTVDAAALQAWKGGIVKKLTGGVRMLLKGNKVELLAGTARLADAKTVEVTGSDGSKTTLSVRKGIVLATGARPSTIPGFALDGDVVGHAKHAVSWTEVPERLVVIGGGVIGLELGTAWAKLGARVTVIELMPQLLPGIDPDLVAVVARRLGKLDVAVHTSASARGAVVNGKTAKVTFEVAGNEQTVEADRVLVAVGFRANTEELGLPAAGVNIDSRGFVPVDAKMRTNVPTVLAIGDLVGPPFLAHRASKQGEVAAEVLAGRGSEMDAYAMPAAIFTDPEIGVVGLSETEAKARGQEVRVGKFPFAASGRAMAALETEGFVKVLTDPSNQRILGVGIVGPEASDLVAEAGLALEMTATAEDVGLTIHAHPTLAEVVMEAAKASVGEAIHILNR